MIYGNNPDSLVPDIGAIIQSSNLYSYCGGNPIMFIDKTGRDRREYIEQLTPEQAARRKEALGQSRPVFSFILDMAPGVGEAKAISEVITGRDLVTGECLTTGQRWLTAISIVTPFVSGAKVRAVSGIVADVAKGTGRVPSASTKVNLAPEIKAPNAMRSSNVTNSWDNYLGKNTTNINPRTGLADPNRIFSADGSRAIRFGSHEMNSLGTPKGHFHFETWRYDAVNDVFNVTNTLQRIIP
jgi:hypothetical protein